MMVTTSRVLLFVFFQLVALVMVVDAQPRRGPPRGPVKEDKSTFFGKEGEQAQRTDPMLSLALKIGVVVLGAAVVMVQFAGGGGGGKKKTK